MSVHRRASNERTHDGARVAFAGNPNFTHAVSIAPPALRDGQVRCPVCRNGVGPTLGGNLRKHNDLFGHACYNRATGEPTGIETPDVVLPRSEPPAPRRPAQLTRPSYSTQPADGRLRTPDGRCHECDRPVTGERRFCGPCLARRSR